MLVVNFKVLPVHVIDFRSPKTSRLHKSSPEVSWYYTVAHCMEEWIEVPRTEVNIRHNMVVQDGIRAAVNVALTLPN